MLDQMRAFYRIGRLLPLLKCRGGANPSYAHGYYDRDNASYLAWDKIAAERDVFKAWMAEHVLGVGPEIFAARVQPLRKEARG